MDIVKKLQRKTDKQKKNILIFSLTVLMILVIFVWFIQMKNYSFFYNKTQLSPIVDIKDQAVSLYNKSASEVQSFKEAMNEM